MLGRGLADGDGGLAGGRRFRRAGDPAARLAEGSAPLPVAGVEVLLERAVTAADRYSPDAERAGLRAAVAAASLAGASAAVPGSPRQRALAAGFAASASSAEQLAALRAWLSGGARPDGLELDGDLRGRVLRTLAARGLATEEDLDALAADPVGGAQHLLTCRALRPDAAAKAAAWELALAEGQDRRRRMRPRAGSGYPDRRRCSALAGHTGSATSPRRCPRSTAGRSARCGGWPGRCTRPRWPSPPR